MNAGWVNDDGLEVTCLARLKILVVDDHEINRLAVSLILKPTGADVTCASSAAEAMEQLAHRPFDALVMDGAMPGFAGAHMVLRDLPGPNASVPVSPITARAGPEGPDVSLAAGMRVEIGRTIDPAALCACLGALSPLRPGAASAAA